MSLLSAATSQNKIKGGKRWLLDLRLNIIQELVVL